MRSTTAPSILLHTLSLSLFSALFSALIFPMTIVCYVCVFVCVSLCSSVLLHKSDAGAQSRLRFERIDTVVSSTFYPAIHPKGEEGGGGVLTMSTEIFSFYYRPICWFFWGLLFAREGRPPFFAVIFLLPILNQLLFSERSVSILFALFLFDGESECVA